MRQVMQRSLYGVALVASSVLAACGTGEVTTTNQSVRIVAPAANSEQTEGVAFDVEVAATGGIPVVVLQVPGKEAMTATVDNELATFKDVTVSTVGDVTLRATISGFSEAVCQENQCAETVIRVLPAGGGGTCFFSSPRQDDTIRVDQYPNDVGVTSFDPVEIDIAGECTGVEDNAVVGVSLNGQSIGNATVTNSAFVIPRVVVQQGQNNVSLTVDGENADQATFAVSTGQCIVNLELGDGTDDTHTSTTLTSANDSSAASGLQYDFSITTDCAEGSSWRLQWAPVSDSPLWSNVEGGVGTLSENLGAGDQAATVKFRIDGSLLRLPEADANQKQNFYLIARVDDATSDKTGWSVPSEYYFDSQAPDLTGISDADLGINGCLSSSDTDDSLDGVQLDVVGLLAGEPDGRMWVRAYDTNMPPSQCTEDEGTACADVAGYSCVADSAGTKHCRRLAVLDGDGNFTAAGVTVPYGEVIIEFMGVDALGNKGELRTIAQDVVPSDGASAPDVGLLQVGTQVVATMANGAIADVGAGDVTLNFGDKSAAGSGAFSVDVVVGAINVPIGSTLQVKVANNLRGEAVIEAAGNTFESSTTTIPGVQLTSLDGVSANQIRVDVVAPDVVGELNCFPTTLFDQLDVYADTSIPAIDSSSLVVGAVNINSDNCRSPQEDTSAAPGIQMG
ncbi:MAG: hypothetical protein VX834_07415, partial [Myxococcota bacterium]|nr:hypothetical protein [Myxococcota bacterium]